MLLFIQHPTLLSINIESILSTIQTSEALSITLLIISAILSALLSEMLLTKKLQKDNSQEHNLRRNKPPKNKPPKNKPLSPFILALLCAVIFLLELLLVIAIIAAVFQFLPHDESLRVLLQKILQSYGSNFLLPFLTAMLAGYALRSLKENKASAKVLLAVLLFISTVLGSLEFFLSSFRLVERPYYPVPVEAVTSIINSRLSVYPFILTEEILWSIGDGGELLAQLEDDSDVAEQPVSGDETPIVYEEPNTISGYIEAVLYAIYADGMNEEDYLLKVHALFLAGDYSNDDLFYIGVMWQVIYDDIFFLSDGEPVTRDCLWEALAAYERVEELEGGSAPLYSNMANVYSSLEDWEQMRHYIREALAYGVEASYAWSNYKGHILWELGLEPYAQLMQDAQEFLSYGEDLSIYILYGACAVAENQEVESAYGLLCDADLYYEGKSAMVKILRCICADLTGRDEAFLLADIYKLEAEKGLTETEEAYLMRYLFATNRSQELWGYIADAGSKGISDSHVAEVAMKASWYFKNVDTDYFNEEDARQLLEQIEEALSVKGVRIKDRNLLSLSKALLQSCLGEDGISEGLDIEDYELDGISDIEYALGAVNAFNKGSYAETIDYCEGFFRAEAAQRDVRADEERSWQDLEPQEQMTLHYYVQLLLANAHFEYAQLFRKDSEEWIQHMEIAERECDAFEQSSKSLFYIGEQFRSLKNGIDVARERIPDEPDSGPLPVEMP